jgi:hypothetical protein
MLHELALNLCQSGLISFHGISARAAVYVDIDEPGSQDQVRKIKSVARRHFRGAARLKRSDAPIFHNDHRRFNPFNGSNQARGGNDCGHEDVSAQFCLHVLRCGCKHKARRKFSQRAYADSVSTKNQPLFLLKLLAAVFPLWNRSLNRFVKFY